MPQITEDSVLDRVEVAANGIIGVRRLDRTLRDGVVIASTVHRETIEPGADLATHPERVRTIAATVWTPEVVKTFQEARDASMTKIGGG